MAFINCSVVPTCCERWDSRSKAFFADSKIFTVGIEGLSGLGDTFGTCAGLMGASMLANLLQSGGIPPAMFVPPPNMGGCRCGGHYATSVDFERRLQFTRACSPSANPTAMIALGLLDGISRSAAACGSPQMFGAGAFHHLMLGALANVLGGGHQPAVDGPYQGAFGLGHGSDASVVLSDPTLTVEDKVCLFLMMIMKKMDQDIEKMMNYINSLQQQQQQNGGKSGKGGKGGKGGGGGGGSSPSIDVETMKLKRLIDKRSQMFDMLRQIIDKYNQTAKGIIDSMQR